MRIGSVSSTQLTAPSTAGTAARMDHNMPVSAEFEVTVASINTNCVVVAQYSDDGYTTTISGDPKTITANGKHNYPAAVNYQKARLYFLSESGGTAVTIDYKVVMFG